MKLVEDLRQWRKRWASRRLRAQVTLLQNRVLTLEGELQVERATRAREYKAVAGALRWLSTRDRERAERLLEHRAWIGALVDVSQGNTGRYRDLCRSYTARMEASRPPPAPDVAPATEATAPAATGGS